MDPRVGEDLLETLRDLGVAAYLEPKTTNDPYLLATSLPSPPLDRLWVDREARERAAEALDQPDLEHAPASSLSAQGHGSSRTDGTRNERFELNNADVDARFAELIAGFGAASDVPDRPTATTTSIISAPTVAEDDDEVGHDDLDADELLEDEEEPAAESAPAQSVIWRGPTGGLGPAAHDPAEHYNPPDPPPVRWPSVQAQLGILVIIVGAALLFFPAILSLSGDASVILGVLGIAGGTWLLIQRMRRTPLEDDDDGAIV